MRRTRLKPTAVLTIDPKPYRQAAPADGSRRSLAIGLLVLLNVTAIYVVYGPPTRLALGIVTAFLDHSIR
jgi:hypothetical protein